MIYLLGIVWILVPYFLGKGIIDILCCRKGRRGMDRVDSLFVGVNVIIGLAEAFHLGAVLAGWSLHVCVKGFGMAVSACLGAALLASLFVRRGQKEDPKERVRRLVERKRISLPCQLLAVLAAVLMILQLISVFAEPEIYLEGDMTLETVNSFLAEDGVYRVNPLTGAPYEAGMPLRLKILCLPTLYAFLCRIFSVEAQQAVWHLIPALMLIYGYLAYFQLSGILFHEEREKRICFLILVVALLWVEDYLFGMDGFGALHSGFRGVSIRGLLLLPYTFSLALRKKWSWAALCILAEACLVWTFYGLGACLFVTAGMYLAGRLVKRKEAFGAGKEASHV